MSQLPQNPDRRARLHGLVDDLYDQGFSSDKEQLAIMIKKSLKADVLFQSPAILLPMNEVDERHDHAKAIQKGIRAIEHEFSLNAAHVAVILNVPMTHLRPRGDLSAKTVDGYNLMWRLNGLVNLSRHYLIKYSDNEFSRNSGSASHTPHKKRSRKGDDDNDDYHPRSASRRGATIKIARERDGNACIFMRTSNPEVAHVIPVAWNESQVKIKKTKTFFDTLPILMTNPDEEAPWITTYGPILADSANPGSTDKSWNTLCLNRQLHHWWGKAFLGLKFIGSLPVDKKTSKAQVLFNWMVHDSNERNRNMNIDGPNSSFMDMVRVVETFQNNGGSAPELMGQDGEVAALNVKTGVPVVSGRVIEIEMPTEDVEKFRTMLDIQWACIKIAAMAGSAGWPESPYNPHDWDEGDEAVLRTEDWVADQAELLSQQNWNIPSPAQQPEVLPLRATTNQLARDDSPTKVSQGSLAQGQQQHSGTGKSENVHPGDV